MEHNAHKIQTSKCKKNSGDVMPTIICIIRNFSVMLINKIRILLVSVIQRCSMIYNFRCCFNWSMVFFFFFFLEQNLLYKFQMLNFLTYKFIFFAMITHKCCELVAGIIYNIHVIQISTIQLHTYLYNVLVTLLNLYIILWVLGVPIYFLQPLI